MLVAIREGTSYKNWASVAVLGRNSEKTISEQEWSMLAAYYRVIKEPKYSTDGISKRIAFIITPMELLSLPLWTRWFVTTFVITKMEL